MRNVSKLLAAAALCGAATLPSLTPPQAAATDTAATETAIDATTETAAGGELFEREDGEVVEYGAGPASAPAQTPRFFIKEEFTDECPGDVSIKIPYPNPDSSSTPSLDSQDLILARSPELCALVGGSPPTHDGVCQLNAWAESPWSDRIKYSSIMNGETRRFRWFCNTTRERSRCPEKTTHVRFKLTPGGGFKTRCLRQIF